MSEGSPKVRGSVGGARRRARLVLWLGLLALAMNALTGLAHLVGARSGGSAAIEICTHAGIVRVDALWLDPQESETPEVATEMRCCDLCGARAAAVIADASPRAVLMLAAADIGARAPPPEGVRPHTGSTPTPIVPRGPPVTA